MLVCALPQFASLATITHLGTHREMSCRFGETRIFSTVMTSANCIYRLLLNHRAKTEISLTLFEKKGGGNRRGGKIAPLTPAPPRFEGVQVSRSGACLSLCCRGHLSVSPVSPSSLAAVFEIGGCHRSILYRLFKTTAAAAT